MPKLKKNAEKIVEPHAKKYAPIAKSYVEKTKIWLEKFSDKIQYLFMYYRQEAIDVLSSQDNISNEGAAYIVDLFLFTMIYIIFVSFIKVFVIYYLFT